MIASVAKGIYMRVDLSANNVYRNLARYITSSITKRSYNVLKDGNIKSEERSIEYKTYEWA